MKQTAVEWLIEMQKSQMGMLFESDIEKAKEIFKNYEYWIITSRNHQKLKNDKVCDRFRIFFLLEESLNDSSLREIFINNIMERYPYVDSSCRNRSRFYYASPADAICLYNKGSKFKIINLDFTNKQKEAPKVEKEPIKHIDEVFILNELTGVWINKYGEVLEQENNTTDTEYYLKGAISILNDEFVKGNRNNCMFKVICMLLKDGLDEQVILDFIIAENDQRGKIPFNELMACFKSAKRNI